MRVFIAEKPSLAKAIAAVLPGPQKRHKTYIQSGEANVVVWCAGHILTQYMPEDYDPRFKRWIEADLPIIPPAWKMNVAPRTKDLYQTIKKFAADADIIVHAGDPDREGQLLVDEVLTQIGNRQPVKRLLISDLNAASVKRAIGRLEDNGQYSGLRDAALGRSRADWLFGLNLTRLYTVKGRNSGHSGVLSVGRVQTPVLGLVVRRDREIEAFVSKPFYELTVDLEVEHGGFRAKWVPGQRHEAVQDEDGRVIDRQVVEQLGKSLEGSQGHIASVKTQRKREAPPLPFSLPELQKVANKGRGLSPKKTLAVAQSLYEKHQVLTYPRSDCPYLPVDHWVEGGVVRDAIVQSVGDKHALYPLTESVSLVHRGRCWNDKKVTAHHAIIPTSKWVPLDSLSPDERWIYEIVAHRYLLQFCVDREYDQTDVIAKLDTQEGEESFKALGIHDVQLGWREYRDLLRKSSKPAEFDSQEEELVALPTLAQGEVADFTGAQLLEKNTTPPKHFTEATLLDAMTSIARYVSDPELKKVLRETDGLGTPATQAGIIDTLFKRGYLGKKSKSVISTLLGREMIDVLPAAVTLPDMTAHWEMQLARIAEGDGELDDFVDRVVGRVSELTTFEKGKGGFKVTPQPQTSSPKAKKPAEKTYPCPGADCSGRLRRIKGKKGFFWGCTNYGEGCRETRQDHRGKPKDVARTSNIRSNQKVSVTVGETCPDCQKGKIQLRSLKSGKSAGKPFHGCSNFPKCRFFAWPQESAEREMA
ncbi:DNA topoisomerase III [Pseudohalioglobus lutimaris]|uniref:DNA topoisomerase III n=1 Tax=Pseudohalioglobus lutimaris TaxID=1737061 RepID=UPI0013FDBFC0|nr:DNA topoisomerase 3 [Pseudohalioglobus lutimaris]